MKYLFYPGCSMERSAKSYLDSLKAIEPLLGLELQEVEDWNCCGATEYSSINRTASHALVGRNLALAQEISNGANTLMAACSACYLNLSKTDYTMAEDLVFSDKINDALSSGGLSYQPGSLDVRHALDIFFNDIGLDKIKSLVKKPLTGLRVAAYYGCMIVRPDVNHHFDNHEYPTALEKLLEVLGAEVIDFPLKTHCCSGHMTQIKAETAYELIRRLLHGATEYQADILVTLCPMCQLNLDAFQHETNKFFHTDYQVPVLYFTQLIGLAFGLDERDLGLGSEFVDPRPALAKIGAEEPEKPAKPRRKKKDEGLPMPQVSDPPGGGG